MIYSDSVIEWRQFIRDNNLNQGKITTDRQEALKARKLLAEVEQREIRTAILKGEYVALEEVRLEWTTQVGKAIALMRAKFAARKGDTTLLQQFYQKRLALPWREFVEDFKVEIATSAYQMGENWESEAALGKRGKVIAAPFPTGATVVPLRFICVDVQMDHFYRRLLADYR